MTTVSIHQPELEEIEVLIEENTRLINAGKDDIFRPTSSGGNTDEENIGDDTPEVDDEAPTNEGEEDKSEDEVIEFLKDESIDEKTMATITKKKKKSYFSLASKVVVKSLNFRHNERTESPPPPLYKVTTFDTEQSSSSEEEDGDRKCSGTDHSIKLAQQTKEFSTLRVPVVTTIIEEQQKKRDEVHEAQVQKEEEEIDQNLQILYDDNDSGIEIEIECIDGSLKLFQSETEKAKFLSGFVSESDQFGEWSSDNTVAVTPKNNANAPAKTSPKKTRKSSAKQSIRFWKKRNKAPSSPRVEEKPIVSVSEDLVGATAQEEATIVAVPPQEPVVPQAEDGLPEDKESPSPSIDKTKEVWSLPLVEGESIAPGSDNIVGNGTVAEEEIKAESSFPSCVQKSIELSEEKGLPSPFINEIEKEISSILTDEEYMVLENEGVAAEETNVEALPPLPIAEPIESSEDNELSKPCTEKQEEDLPLPLEQKPVVVGSEVISVVAPLVAVEQDEFEVTAPPPSPVRKSIEADQLPFDSTLERLSMSKLLMFEDHPELRAIGPIDLDEVHDHIEQQVEHPPGMPVVPPNDPHSCSNVAKESEGVPESIDLDEVHDRVEQQVKYPPGMPLVPLNDSHSCSNVAKDSEGIPETLSLIPMENYNPSLDVEMDKAGFPETLSLIPPPPQSQKILCTETTTSTRISSSKSFSALSSSTSSISMGERQYRRRSLKRRSSVVYGDFARFKHIVLVAMMCVVVSTGIISNWAMLNEFSLPKSTQALENLTDETCLPKSTQVVHEELPKENLKTKKRNRRFWKRT